MIEQYDSRLFAKCTPEQPEPRKHRWGGCKLGGSPAEESSQEWVRYCEDCGMEDTCEDPLPPCPGPEQPAPKRDGVPVHTLVNTGKPIRWVLESDHIAALAEATRGMVTLEQVEKVVREAARLNYVSAYPDEAVKFFLARLSPAQEQKERDMCQCQPCIDTRATSSNIPAKCSCDMCAELRRQEISEKEQQ